MAHTNPTASEFRTRFPEFSTVSTPRVTAVLGEAGRSVDTTWKEADYKPAIMYLAAHMLVMEDALNAGRSAASGKGPIRSESVGDASVTYAVPSTDNTVSGDLNQSIYGQRFASLRRVNRGGPRVV